MSGVELIKWLNELCCEVLSKNAVVDSPLLEFPSFASELLMNNSETINKQPFNNLQLVGMWQALLDSHYIRHGNF